MLGIVKFHVVEEDKTILFMFYLGYLEFDEEVSYNLGSRLYLDIKTDALFSQLLCPIITG